MDTYLKRYIWLIHLCLIAVVGHSASVLANHLLIREAQSALSTLTPTPQPDMNQKQLKTVARSQRWARTIIDRNLFNANPPDPNKKPIKEDTDVKKEEVVTGKIPDSWENCEESKLSATLKLSVLADPVEQSYASINFDGKDRIYRIGNKIDDRSIVAIQWSERKRRVVLSNQGNFECLSLGQKEKTSGRYTPPKRNASKPDNNNKKENDLKQYVKEISPGRFEVDRAMLDEQLADLDNLVRQARVIPHYKRGKPAGFKVVGIRSNSLFRHLGLKTGDVLKSVGGEELTSINKALSLFDKLKSSNNLSLDFERRGKVSSYEYNIK